MYEYFLSFQQLTLRLTRFPKGFILSMQIKGISLSISKKLAHKLVLFLLAAASAGWIWFSRVETSQLDGFQKPAPQAGFPAPAFTLTTLEGDEFSLSDQRGKAVVLNVWASWCPPCRAEMPALQQVSEEYPPQEVAIVAVNATNQDSLPSVSAFVAQNQLSFPVPLDPGGRISTDYRIASLPTTFFINRQGVIENIIIGGPMPLSLIRTEVDRLLEN